MSIYATENSDIISLIENEKNKIKKENENEKNLLPENLDEISDDILYVINESFNDIFEKKTYNTLFKKDRWKGIGYICILIYLIYFVNTL